MVTEWGMSERVGLVTYKSDNPIFLCRDMEAHSGYSEETAGIIDEEVRKIIESAHGPRRGTFEARTAACWTTWRACSSSARTIYTDEVDMLLDGATVEEVYAHMDSADKKAEKNPFDRFMRAAKGRDGAKKAENTADGKSGAARPKRRCPSSTASPRTRRKRARPKKGLPAKRAALRTERRERGEVNALRP